MPEKVQENDAQIKIITYRKFSAVLGTTSAKSSIFIRPTSCNVGGKKLCKQLMRYSQQHCTCTHFHFVEKRAQDHNTHIELCANALSACIGTTHRIRLGKCQTTGVPTLVKSLTLKESGLGHIFHVNKTPGFALDWRLRTFFKAHGA